MRLRAQAGRVIGRPYEDLVARILELTDGRGADVICNHMAGDSLRRDLAMLAPFGLLVSYGALHGLPESDLFLDMRAQVSRCPAVRCFTMHSFDHRAELRDRCTDKILQLFIQGKIDPVLGPQFPLTEAAAAHRALEARSIIGKIVLKT